MNERCDVDPRNSLIYNNQRPRTDPNDESPVHPPPPPPPAFFGSHFHSKNLLVNVDSLDTFCPTSFDPCVTPSIPAVESPRLGRNCLLFRLNVASVSRIIGCRTDSTTQKQEQENERRPGLARRSSGEGACVGRLEVGLSAYQVRDLL